MFRSASRMSASRKQTHGVAASESSDRIARPCPIGAGNTSWPSERASAADPSVEPLSRNVTRSPGPAAAAASASVPASDGSSLWPTTANVITGTPYGHLERM